MWGRSARRSPPLNTVPQTEQPDVQAARFRPLRLKPREERRLRAGHLWVYSNEVDTGVTPLGDFEPGEPVEVQAADGRPVGTGYVNPHSLICARIVSRDRRHPFSRSLLVHRLKVALGLRERLFPGPWYRLAHGEGDRLPGLVVDRYGEVLVAQLNTAGMERAREDVLAALVKVLRPRAVVLRNDSPVRELEGLPRVVETALGEPPETVELEENGLRFRVPLAGGQKTGWFYDQRDNRARLARYVRGARVLDLFSYAGGWGVTAAARGAREVLCVDSSEAALERVAENARLNGVGERVRTLRADAFEALAGLRAERERFDVVVLDPPAFVKRRRDLGAGTEAYRRLNRMAMQVLAKDGFLVSCSCSFHVDRALLLRLVHEAARHVDRNLQVLEHGHQAPDHPVHPAIPETEYLKCLVLRVSLA